jgi:hypothetical protein
MTSEKRTPKCEDANRQMETECTGELARMGAHTLVLLPPRLSQLMSDDC